MQVDSNQDGDRFQRGARHLFRSLWGGEGQTRRIQPGRKHPEVQSALTCPTTELIESFTLNKIIKIDFAAQCIFEFKHSAVSLLGILMWHNTVWQE